LTVEVPAPEEPVTATMGCNTDMISLLDYLYGLLAEASAWRDSINAVT
jgi:hypothetical protein